jgi:MoxR-like ATPase
MATQNPVEQEGTYPLPEAQTDRFMLKHVVRYPSRREELEILRRMSRTAPAIRVSAVASPAEILAARQLVDEIRLDESLENYIVDLVMATRQPSHYGLRLDDWIQYGASPRATINLALAAKAQAFLAGRAYVTAHDIKEIAIDVLRHRVVPSFEAEAEEKTSELIVQEILNHVRIP